MTATLPGLLAFGGFGAANQRSLLDALNGIEAAAETELTNAITGRPAIGRATAPPAGIRDQIVLPAEATMPALQAMVTAGLDRLRGLLPMADRQLGLTVLPLAPAPLGNLARSIGEAAHRVGAGLAAMDAAINAVEPERDRMMGKSGGRPSDQPAGRSTGAALANQTPARPAMAQLAGPDVMHNATVLIERAPPGRAIATAAPQTPGTAAAPTGPPADAFGAQPLPRIGGATDLPGQATAGRDGGTNDPGGAVPKAPTPTTVKIVPPTDDAAGLLGPASRIAAARPAAQPEAAAPPSYPVAADGLTANRPEPGHPTRAATPMPQPTGPAPPARDVSADRAARWLDPIAPWRGPAGDLLHRSSDALEQIGARLQPTASTPAASLTIAPDLLLALTHVAWAQRQVAASMQVATRSMAPRRPAPCRGGAWRSDRGPTDPVRRAVVGLGVGLLLVVLAVAAGL